MRTRSVRESSSASVVALAIAVPTSALGPVCGTRQRDAVAIGVGRQAGTDIVVGGSLAAAGRRAVRLRHHLTRREQPRHRRHTQPAPTSGDGPVHILGAGRQFLPFSASCQISNISDSPLPGLYIVATPIGNLGDITPRGAKTLASAGVIAAEDTRVTAKLLSHLGLRVPMTPIMIIATNAHAPRWLRAWNRKLSFWCRMREPR